MDVPPNEKPNATSLNPDIGRINFPAKDANQQIQLFKSYGVLILIKLLESDFFLSKGKPYIQKITGKFSSGEILFKNKWVKCILIHIGTSVPENIRDVIIYHELREMYWVKKQGLPQPEAHQLARKEERLYVKKFLSAKEKKIYKKFTEKVERGGFLARPAKRKIIRNKEGSIRTILV
ncbi:MAG: hypothetical protein Q7S73_00800 [bacterium]|nr:hypothetical protein [bacterium]